MPEDGRLPDGSGKSRRGHGDSRIDKGGSTSPTQQHVEDPGMSESRNLQAGQGKQDKRRTRTREFRACWRGSAGYGRYVMR